MNWNLVLEQSPDKYCSKTGEKLEPVTNFRILREDGFTAAAVGYYSESDEKRLEVACIVSAAPEAVAFAKRMAEYFAQNPYGYDDLREQCHAVLRKAFPVKEVSRAS